MMYWKTCYLQTSEHSTHWPSSWIPRKVDFLNKWLPGKDVFPDRLLSEKNYFLKKLTSGEFVFQFNFEFPEHLTFSIKKDFLYYVGYWFYRHHRLFMDFLTSLEILHPGKFAEVCGHISRIRSFVAEGFEGHFLLVFYF